METEELAACDRLIEVLERARLLDRGPALTADDPVREPLLRFALSLLRMRIRPSLCPGWLDKDPVHISVFGGTNSGKSTLLNILLGKSAAGMNVTARFSQHPEAYRRSSLGNEWLADFPSRFSGYERLEGRHPPRQSDQEITEQGYRPAMSVLDPSALQPLAIAEPVADAAVLWDAPDFSTELSRQWMGAVLDSVALAEIVVLAVTDESYADERCAVLYRMVSSAGLALHAVANKIPEGSGRELLDDIKRKLNESWQGKGAALPERCFHRLALVEGESPEQRLSMLLGTEDAGEFRTSIGREAAGGRELKRRVLLDAAAYLGARRDEVLAPLSLEVETAGSWAAGVARITGTEFVDRYRSEYLNGERYEEFNAALLRLMELLEVPGIGPILKALSDVARVPLRLAKGLLKSFFGSGKSDSSQPAEKEALGRFFEAWLASLKSESQLCSRRDAHPAWREIARRLDSGAYQDELVGRFAGAYQDYRARLDREIGARARKIYARLEENPSLLGVLRGANLLGNVAVTGSAVMSGGLTPSDLVLGPAIAGLWRILITEGLDVYVRGQEEGLKKEQFGMMKQLIEEQLERPGRELFVPGVSAAELQAARSDFDRVLAAARRGARA